MTCFPGPHDVIVTLVLAAAEAAFIVHMTVKLENIAHFHQVTHQPMFIDGGTAVGQQELVYKQNGFLLLAVEFEGDDGLGGIDDLANGAGDPEHISISVLGVHDLQMDDYLKYSNVFVGTGTEVGTIFL